MQLNHETYFSPEANFRYMSASQFKAFEKCETEALSHLFDDAEEEKDCFLEGKYFEACICGQKEQFLEDHPEMVSSRGATKGELKSNFRNVDDAVAAFMRQDTFCDIVNKCEQQVIVSGIIAGVKFKGCVDFYDPETGNGYDSKYMKDFHKIFSEADYMYINWYFTRGYHYQAAIYQELIRQTYGKTGKQHLMAVTKETEPDTAYLQFTDEVLRNALDIVAEFAPRYDAIKKGKLGPVRCEKCDYCKSTKIITLPEIIGEYE